MEAPRRQEREEKGQGHVKSLDCMGGGGVPASKVAEEPTRGRRLRSSQGVSSAVAPGDEMVAGDSSETSSKPWGMTLTTVGEWSRHPGCPGRVSRCKEGQRSWQLQGGERLSFLLRGLSSLSNGTHLS